ncbi:MULTISPECIES: GNAT family N-acetyltransferase [unclassified Modestobacter]
MTGSPAHPPMPVHLETARLVLTPEEPADAPWLAELFTARGSGPCTVAEAGERITAMQELWATHGIGALVLRRRPDGEPLGYAAIVVGRGSVAEPELAYELLARHHGQGYATEAARAVLDAAFATGRPRIWSTVRAWNAPSLRVLEKLGFRRCHSTTDSAGELVWLVASR